MLQLAFSTINSHRSMLNQLLLLMNPITFQTKKSNTNSIEAKTIDFLKNATTAVIFMNIFTIHSFCVEPTLKTIMNNGAKLIPITTDYEAANIKVVDAISNHKKHYPYFAIRASLIPNRFAIREPEFKVLE
ncbi:hypothetical protein ACTFIW_003329 [Dictyostelium discoideum]